MAGIVFGTESVDDYANGKILYQFSDSSMTSRICNIYIQADGPNDVVWFDTYRKTQDKTDTVYGHLNADTAEKIGLALIHAARIARGE